MKFSRHADVCRMGCCSGVARNERTIRASMIEDDLLETVISVALNLFYGTGNFN